MKKHLAFYENEWPANIAELTAVENKPFVGYLKGEGVQFTVIPKPVAEGPADNEIWYTVRSESVKYPANRDQFDVSIVNNTYEDGRGIMTFDGPITRIKEYAFDFSSFTSITLPKSLRVVEDGAFVEASIGEVYFMGTLQDWLNITFGDNPMQHASTLYINGTKIEELVIPDGVTSIGEYVFAGCDQLTSVTIPNSVTSIGSGAFGSCSGLTSVTIPESVTSIGSYAFYNCSSLTKTNYTGDIAAWCNIKFGNGYANPIQYSKNLYINNTEIRQLRIPDTVNTIEDYAFYGWSRLSRISIPRSMTSIGNYAFGGCSVQIIQFFGTTDQWRAVSLGEDWYVPGNYDTALDEVSCSNGSVGI